MQLTIGTGITPTVLQRAPWRRLLTVADNVRRYEHRRLDEIIGVRQFLDGDKRPSAFQQERDSGHHEMMMSMIDYSLGKPVHSWKDYGRSNREHRRPGRKGHPPSFYAEIAARYLQLRSEGSYNPVATIAKEWGYPRNTVSGWVRKARQQGHLARGRPGR